MDRRHFQLIQTNQLYSKRHFFLCCWLTSAFFTETFLPFLSVEHELLKLWCSLCIVVMVLVSMTIYLWYGIFCSNLTKHLSMYLGAFCWVIMVWGWQKYDFSLNVTLLDIDPEDLAPHTITLTRLLTNVYIMLCTDL